MSVVTEDSRWEIAPAGSIEHGIVVPNANPDLHVVGRWFPETEGDYRGLLFEELADAEAVRDALNAVG